MAANDYYDSSGAPATGSQGSSATMRAEFDAIETGFNKLPALTGNANKAVVVNGSGTGLTVTAAALALAVALTTAGSGGITLRSTAATDVTLPTTGTLATLAGAETLTNKTITTFGGALTFNPANASATLSPTGTGTVTINPATAGTINNMSIGASTASTGRFTTLTYTDLQSAAPTTGWYTPSADLIRTPNSVTIDDNLVVSGAGPHAIGGATQANRQLLLTGTLAGDGVSAIMAQRVATTLTPGGAVDMYGLSVEPTFNEHSTGTHSLVAALSVGMTINAGAANVTDAVGLNILTFAAQATTTNAAGLKIAAPTGATNNYGAWITSGSLRIDGGTITTGNTTALSLATSGGTQFRVSNTASAVNFIRVSGAATASAPFVVADGSDTNVTLDLISKGSGSIRLYTGFGVDRQVEVLHTASATRHITLTGSNGGNPTIGTSAGDLVITSGVNITGTVTTNTASAIAFGAAAGEAAIYTFGANATTRGILKLITLESDGGGGEVARITSGGYFKASNNGTYDNTTGTYHELYQGDDVAVPSVIIKHAGATATNQYAISAQLSLDPNNTSNYFFQCIGNATERATIRSNGGLANFQANDVNLCDVSVKDGVYPAGSYLDFIRSIGIFEGRYKDDPTGKMHTMFVAQDIEQYAPELITPWNDKGLKGVLEHDIMLRHVRATQELADLVDSNDLYYRGELEHLREWKVKAAAAMAQHGITIH